MAVPRRLCSVESCRLHATARSEWCYYHRRLYHSGAARAELERPADLIPTGMIVDQAGVLELLGGVRIAAPPNLSLSYYFGDLVNSRMQLLLPASKLRVHLVSLREHLRLHAIEERTHRKHEPSRSKRSTIKEPKS